MTKEEHDEKFKRFEKDIEIAVNKNSMENYCNMPDFLIAEYLVHCFNNLCVTVNKNDKRKDK